MMANRFRNLVVRFHKDKLGMETVQIIMMLAIAAMVCLGVTKVAGVNTGGAGSDGWFGTVKTIAESFLKAK